MRDKVAVRGGLGYAASFALVGLFAVGCSSAEVCSDRGQEAIVIENPSSALDLVGTATVTRLEPLGLSIDGREISAEVKVRPSLIVGQTVFVRVYSKQIGKGFEREESLVIALDETPGSVLASYWRTAAPTLGAGEVPVAVTSLVYSTSGECSTDLGYCGAEVSCDLSVALSDGTEATLGPGESKRADGWALGNGRSFDIVEPMCTDTPSKYRGGYVVRVE